jgi:hypothetical protein
MSMSDRNEGGQHLKVTLFFPLRDNEGDTFEEEIWDSWKKELTKLLSGFTDLGVVSGWWQGQSDQNQWIVAVIDGMEQVDALRRFLRSARRMFRQDAMHLEWHPVHFELVT